MRNSRVNFVTHVTRRNFNHDGPQGLIKFRGIWNFVCLTEICVSVKFKVSLISVFSFTEIFAKVKLKDQNSPDFFNLKRSDSFLSYHHNYAIKYSLVRTGIFANLVTILRHDHDDLVFVTVINKRIKTLFALVQIVCLMDKQ